MNGVFTTGWDAMRIAIRYNVRYAILPRSDKEEDHRSARDLRSRHCLTVTSSAMSPCDQFIQGIDNLMAFICERLNKLSQRVFGDRDCF